MSIRGERDEELERAKENLVNSLADEMAMMREGEIGSRDEKVERARQQARKQVSAFCDRFTKGYEALLEELSKHNEEG